MNLLKQLFTYCIIACPLVLSGYVFYENGNYWVGVWYFVMSVVSFVAYVIDKRRAVGGKWRISERVLHLLELCGGFPGAKFAQMSIKHKSKKRSYQVIFWLIVLLHLAVWWDYFVGGYLSFWG